MQLASEIVPSLKALKKEGDAGRKVVTKYTRVGTVLLAAAQSFGVATFVYQQNIVVVSQFEFSFPPCRAWLAERCFDVVG